MDFGKREPRVRLYIGAGQRFDSARQALNLEDDFTAETFLLVGDDRQLAGLAGNEIRRVFLYLNFTDMRAPFNAARGCPELRGKPTALWDL